MFTATAKHKEILLLGKIVILEDIGHTNITQDASVKAMLYMDAVVDVDDGGLSRKRSSRGFG
jgi:hypothetical protein